MVPLNVAVEDELSEVVLRRILANLGRYSLGSVHRRGGYGYLKRTIEGWNHAARGIPIVVLADLDDALCASYRIKEWLPHGRHPNLLFRVAVREVESWVLADGVGIAKFLGIQEKLVPASPDRLTDPKSTLIDLARKSHYRPIRESIVPATGSTAKQGPDYNGCLAHFVTLDWKMSRATERSGSLAKAVTRLSEFQPVWAK